MRARLVAGLALAVAANAAAVETTQWPPPPEVLGRMRDLQAVIVDPQTPREQRAAARADLERLMKGPAARDRAATNEKKPARAAIDPFPSVVKPAETRLPAPPTARLEVIPEAAPRPARPAANPATGGVVQPSAPGVAVDPRTGHLLHEVPGGYVDPRTGRFVPR